MKKSRTPVRLAIRDWDFLTPIVVGDVRSSDFDVTIERLDALIADPAGHPNCDGAEVSFSRYARERAEGTDGLIGLPHFLMRAFRHRCIITAKASPITRLADLAGKTIGLEGWPDSGHIWTRALLRREGVGIGDVKWRVGRLTDRDPIRAHAGDVGWPGRIEILPGDRPTLGLLETGEIDAVFAPFMPPEFTAADSRLRALLPDYRAAEVAYAHDVGYVPGIHVLALKPEIVEAYPGLPAALSELIDESSRVWRAKRLKYAETTPWMIDELARSARDLKAGWDRNGYAANEAMIADFAEELFAQRLTARRLTPRELFPAMAG